MNTFHYIRSFVRDHNVASITPTSRFGVRHVCKHIDFGRDLTIVEYGPATGVFSKYLLTNMTAGSRLILIERNKNFVNILNKKLISPRVQIFHDNAMNVLNILQQSYAHPADYIVSGIPFSIFDNALTNDIISSTHKALKNGGKFLVYQHFNHLEEHLERYFDQVKITREFFNIPPLTIFVAQKDFEIKTKPPDYY